MTDYEPSAINIIGSASTHVQPSPGNPHTFNPENELPQYVLPQGNGLGRSPQGIEGVGRAPQTIANEYAESHSAQQQQIDRSSGSPNSGDPAVLPPYTPLFPGPVDAVMSSSLPHPQSYPQSYPQAQQQMSMPYPTYSGHQSHVTLVRPVPILTPNPDNPDQFLATDYSLGVNGTYASSEPKLVDTTYTPEAYISSPRKRVRRVLCFCFVAVALAIILGVIFGVVLKKDDLQKDSQRESSMPTTVPSTGSKTTSTRSNASRTFAWSTTSTTAITTTVTSATASPTMVIPPSPPSPPSPPPGDSASCHQNCSKQFNQCSNTCSTKEKSCEASCGGDTFDCGWSCSKEASDCRFSCHSDSSSCSLEC